MSEENELDQLRQQRMEELKARMAQQQNAEQQAVEAEQQLDGLLRQVLEPEAKARLSNIRLVNRELYYKTAQTIAYIAKSGKLHQKISEAELKKLLERLSPPKKEIRIKRK